MEIIIIAAVSRNNVIGKEGNIPWHSKAEFRHFKKTTYGCPVIMGRRTCESIGKPLPGRMNIVISRREDYDPGSPDIIKYSSLKDAVDFCQKNGEDKIFIIGGYQIYKESMTIADKLIISVMKFETEGDTFFPRIESGEWNIYETEDFEEFEVRYYRRIE